MLDHKKIRLRVTFEVDALVPYDWNEKNILHYYNESSFCKDNLLRDKLNQVDDHVNQVESGCSCWHGDVEIVKEDVRREEE
jgi:hypothetical protein